MIDKYLLKTININENYYRVFDLDKYQMINTQMMNS